MTNTELSGGDAVLRVAVLEQQIAALEAEKAARHQAVQSAYAVIDHEGNIEYSVTVAKDTPTESNDWAQEMCHAHINDEINNEADGAGSWVVRPIHIGLAPTEQVDQEPVEFWVLFDAHADQKYIKKSITDGSLAFFDTEAEARRAKRHHAGTDYKHVRYYTTPQPSPAPAAPDVAGLVDVSSGALSEIECIMQEAYNSAEPVCCGRPGQECCGNPEPEWSEAAEHIMDRLAPHQKALSKALATFHREG